MTICTHPTTLGKIPVHLDPFGLISGGQHYPVRLRFADEGGDGSGTGGDGEGSGDDEDADEKLGDAGTRALERTKQNLRTTKADLKAFADLGLTPAEIKAIVDEKNAGTTPDAEAIRKQAEKDAKTAADERLHSRLRASTVREQAASLGFIDPGDALRTLNAADLADIEVDDNDEVDGKAVKKLLDELAKTKPYLLKSTDSTADHRTAGIGAGGSTTVAESTPGVGRMRDAYAESTPVKRK